MKDESSKLDNQKRPHSRLLSIVSLYCGLASLVIAVGKSLTFYFYLDSGGLNTLAAEIYSLLFAAHLVMWAFVPLVGLISLILAPFRKPRLRNLILPALGLLFWYSGWMIDIYSSFGFSFDKERMEAVRYFAHNEMWLDDMKRIKTQIQEYVQQNNGKLPPAENWREVLVALEPNDLVHTGHFRLNELKQRSRYAFNRNLSKKDLAELPHDAVLFFETKQIENPMGNGESITGENHYGKGCIVLFADLHIEFVKAEDFNDLRWEP